MKKLSMLLVLLVLSLTPIRAQTIPKTANLTASDSGACTTAGACLTVNVTNSSASSVIQLDGTFSATLQFEGVSQQGGTFVSVSATPVSGGTAVTSATATGAWRVTVSGLAQIRVRCSTYSSGTVAAAITLSTGSSGTSSSGGSGSGSVTSVDMTVPGGFAVSGVPITTSGTIGLSTNAAGADYALTSTAANVSAWKQINGGSSCGDGSHAVSYSISTHLFGCQAISVGTGTVTSAALTTPSWLTVAGSPITTSGTFAVTATTAQTSHQVIGTCNAATTFAPCSLVTGDLPTLVAGQNGLAASATTDTTVATNITSGTLPAARLPNPTASTLGGVESLAAVTHNFLTSISTSGVPAQAQPACADLSNAAASCSTDTTVATNITSGTLPAGRLPNPSASTLGGVESIASVSHDFLTSISTSGVPTQAQPACGDLSNAATSCSTDATNASNISAGSLNIARLPTAAGGTVLGNVTGSSAAPTYTTQPVLGVAGASVGALSFANTVSGTVQMAAVNSALGSSVINIPAASGTMAVSATSPITESAAGAVACATCTTNASALTNNELMAGAGSQASKVITNWTTDATNTITAGSGAILDLNANVNQFKNYPCAPQFSTTDTLTNASITTEQVFATNCSIPANSLVANKALRVWLGVDATMTTTPSYTFRMKLCSVSGCGSGTVVNVYVPPTNVVATSFTGVSGGVQFVIQGAAAAGSSVAVNTSVMVNPDAGATNGPFGHNTLTTSTGGIPTNGTLFLSFSITYSSTTGTNSMTLTQLVTEWLN